MRRAILVVATQPNSSVHSSRTSPAGRASSWRATREPRGASATTQHARASWPAVVWPARWAALPPGRSHTPDHAIQIRLWDTRTGVCLVTVTPGASEELSAQPVLRRLSRADSQSTDLDAGHIESLAFYPHAPSSLVGCGFRARVLSRGVLTTARPRTPGLHPARPAASSGRRRSASRPPPPAARADAFAAAKLPQVRGV